MPDPEGLEPPVSPQDSRYGLETNPTLASCAHVEVISQCIPRNPECSINQQTCPEYRTDEINMQTGDSQVLLQDCNVRHLSGGPGNYPLVNPCAMEPTPG